MPKWTHVEREKVISRDAIDDSPTIALNFDLYDTQGELKGFEKRGHVLCFISFPKITLHRGYKFDKIALFDFCIARRHNDIRFSEF